MPVLDEINETPPLVDLITPKPLASPASRSPVPIRITESVAEFCIYAIADTPSVGKSSVVEVQLAPLS